MWGGTDPGDHCFRPRVVGVVEAWREFSSMDKNLYSLCAAGRRRWPEGELSPRAGSMGVSRSATTQWGWGFHTVWSGIDPWDHHLGSRDVGVVNVWKSFKSGDETLSSRGVARPRHCPRRQLSPRAGSTSLNQSATTQWGWGFHTLRGVIDTGDLPFRLWVAGVVEIWKDF